MARAEIDPTGCCVCRGGIRIRFNFYLDQKDPHYEDFRIQECVIPLGGYPGKVDNELVPVDMKDYNAWSDSLPKITRTVPFHNHFVYVNADTSYLEIKRLMLEYLNEFLIIKCNGGDILKEWKEDPQRLNMQIASLRLDISAAISEEKIALIKEQKMEVEVVNNGN